jgi:prevent-host-death family protein
VHARLLWREVGVLAGLHVGYYAAMNTVTLSEAKVKLSGLIEQADSTHETVSISRHGRSSVVLMAADDLESLQGDPALVVAAGYS